MSNPFIICEIGSNWLSIDDCMNSITQAKFAGADAVKFQAYDGRALYGVPYGLPGVLDLNWIPKLKEKSDAVGIEFMCSTFGPSLLEAIDPFLKRHKVASSEMCHVRMLETLKELGKPVILSTGAQTFGDIRNALYMLDGVPTTVLYCVAAYPANEIDFGQMELMAKAYDLPVGFSDHTTDVRVIPAEAVRRGATVIEKHVNFVGATGPDAPHSISGEQFTTMVKVIRGTESHAPRPMPAERDMIMRHKRRLIATMDIPEGGILKEGENYGIYRSLKDETHAFSPFLVDQVNGKTARKAITAGDGIGPGDI